MAETKLSRATLAEQVAQAVLERIEHDGLKPGDPLPSIGKLADEFSVSKPIIREALKTLEGREIIIISNGRTPVVKPITSDSLRTFFERAIALDSKSLIELLEVRRGLEIQSAILAAQHCRPEELAQMYTLLSEMRAHLYESDRYAELDLELHLLIAAASRNSLMYHLIQSIRDVLKDTITEGLRNRFDDEQLRQVQALHEAVVAALASHDRVQASQAMAEHFDDAINAIYRATIAPDNLVSPE